MIKNGWFLFYVSYSSENYTIYKAKLQPRIHLLIIRTSPYFLTSSATVISLWSQLPLISICLAADMTGHHLIHFGAHAQHLDHDVFNSNDNHGCKLLSTYHVFSTVIGAL